MVCPYCGGRRTPWTVYKHRWWVCGGCGNATSELRASLPHDWLPGPIVARLPARLRVDPAVVADPGLQWFVPAHYPSASAEGTPYAGEVEKVRSLLARFDLAATGAILDLSGGPGFVAQALGAGGARVVLTECVPHAVQFARERLGVDTRIFDYQGAPLETVVEGPFDLVMARYSLNHCLDPVRLAASLHHLTGPGAGVLVAGVLSPSRGACLTSALEDGPPRVLWDVGWLVGAFARGGWRLEAAFTTDPPMPYWRPRSPRYRVFSLPWELMPGPLPRDVHQHHPGMLFRREDTWTG